MTKGARFSAALFVLAGVLASYGVRPVGAQPLMLPVRGDPSAPVVILLFSDFECSACAKVEPILADIRREFPRDVRVVFKHNPLSIHPHAPLAHEAAIEAARQGKFWEMHDLLFKNQAKLEREALLGYARELRLDEAAFVRALDERTHRPLVERDMAEARALGLTGTPVLFINGRRAQGVPPAAPLTAVIKSLASGGDGTPEATVVPLSTFDLTGSPTKGPDGAAVTIVEFSDFQCGFCARTNGTVAQVLAKYPDQVRLVFKHLPLDLHKEAPLAHRAAFAAQQQGKFWEMHDAIFANQPAMTRADLLKHASTLDLDIARFTADMDGNAAKGLIDRDLAEAGNLGIAGTPAFFINGQPIVGARSLDVFVTAVEKALAPPSGR